MSEEERSDIIKCPSCYGRGVEWDGSTCAVCDGNKTITLPSVLDPLAWRDVMVRFKPMESESRHVAGDDLLIALLKRLGYGEMAEQFDSWDKWYA